MVGDFPSSVAIFRTDPPAAWAATTAARSSSAAVAAFRSAASSFRRSSGGTTPRSLAMPEMYHLPVRNPFPNRDRYCYDYPMSPDTAREVPAHRRTSPIGGPQRHFRLASVLVTPIGITTDVVLVAGTRAVYVYPATVAGEIADFDALLAEFPAGTAPEDALNSLGYDAAA